MVIMQHKKRKDDDSNKENINPETNSTLKNRSKKQKIKNKSDASWRPGVDGKSHRSGTHSFTLGVNMSYTYKDSDDNIQIIKFYFLISKQMLADYGISEEQMQQRIQEKIMNKFAANKKFNEKNQEAIEYGKKNKKEFTPSKIKSLTDIFTDKPKNNLQSPGGTEYKLVTTGIKSGIYIYCNADINPKVVANRDALKMTSEQVKELEKGETYQAITKPTSTSKHSTTLITKQALSAAKKEREKTGGRKSNEQNKAMAVEPKNYAQASATLYGEELNVFAEKTNLHWGHQKPSFVDNTTSPTKLSAITKHANWNQYNTGESLILFLKDKYPEGFIYDAETITLPIQEIENDEVVRELDTHLGDEIHLTFQTPGNPDVDISFDALHTGELHHATQIIHKIVYESIFEIFEENKEEKNSHKMEITDKPRIKTQKKLVGMFDEQDDKENNEITEQNKNDPFTPEI